MQFKQASQSLTSNSFVRLKANESIVGVFRGEPYEFKTHWLNGASEKCIGDACALCKDRIKPTFRFRLNFITKDSAGSYTAKIFEQGWNVYRALADLTSAGHDLEKNVVKITRYGSGKNDTSYSVVPTPNGQVSEPLEKTLSQVKLYDLVNPEDQNAPQPLAEDEVPF